MSYLDEKREEIFKKYENLSLQDKIDIIAQCFGAKTGEIETSPCTGKWRGTSDIFICFDNDIKFGIGNDYTPQTKTKATQTNRVNSMLKQYNPEIIELTKRTAFDALRKRETEDNKVAENLGLKPYTMLNVELGGCDNPVFVGWYYVTLAIDGKIRAHMDSKLSSAISAGTVSETHLRYEYLISGGVKEKEVDYVFDNIGFSSVSDLYSLPISDDVIKRAEQTLKERETERQGSEKIPMPDPSITVKDMNDYGYTYGGMLPLNTQAALSLFEYCDVYLLYEDDTDGAAMSVEEISNFDGIFGVEKDDWERVRNTYPVFAEQLQKVNTPPEPQKKPSLSDRIASAEAKQSDANVGKDKNIEHENER